jgi:hypothetical protein
MLEKGQLIIKAISKWYAMWIRYTAVSQWWGGNQRHHRVFPICVVFWDAYSSWAPGPTSGVSGGPCWPNCFSDLYLLLVFWDWSLFGILAISLLKLDANRKLTTHVFDKRDYFDFPTSTLLTYVATYNPHL